VCADWRHHFSERDTDGAASIYHEDVVTTEPAPGRAESLAEWKAYAEALRRACPDAHMMVQTVLESGDTVAVEARFAGTFTGPLSPKARYRPRVRPSSCRSRTSTGSTADACPSITCPTTRWGSRAHWESRRPRGRSGGIALAPHPAKRGRVAASEMDGSLSPHRGPAKGRLVVLLDAPFRQPRRPGGLQGRCSLCRQGVASRGPPAESGAKPLRRCVVSSGRGLRGSAYAGYSAARRTPEPAAARLVA
jgi:hypothetical protein